MEEKGTMDYISMVGVVVQIVVHNSNQLDGSYSLDITHLVSYGLP